MADRTLRGSRLGAVSYETEYGAEPAPRNVAAYRCQRGHEFTVPFSEDAEIPTTLGVPPRRLRPRAHRRPGAGGQEGQATAYPLGHAHGAAHGRRSGRGPRRAVGRAARAPRDEVRLTVPDQPPDRTAHQAPRLVRGSLMPSLPADARASMPAHQITDLRARCLTPHSVTRHSASRTIAPLILLSPRSRSANVIGTSTTRKPARTARQTRSTWKQ